MGVDLKKLWSKLRSVRKKLTVWTLDLQVPDGISIFLVKLTAFLNIAFVTSILFMGCWTMTHGVLEFFDPTAADDQIDKAVKITAEMREQSAMASLLGGLEFYLLAPLGYLFLRSLADFMQRYRKDEIITEESSASLMSVKGLTAGLLITVLATHLVAIFLKDHDRPYFPAKEILAGFGILVVLIGYYVVLHRHVGRVPVLPALKQAPEPPQGH
ncbi:MAG: hypothetical protein QM796_20600 [Chthoniobacteraceae bacterium]